MEPADKHIIYIRLTQARHVLVFNSEQRQRGWLRGRCFPECWHNQRTKYSMAWVLPAVRKWVEGVPLHRHKGPHCTAQYHKQHYWYHRYSNKSPRFWDLEKCILNGQRRLWTQSPPRVSPPSTAVNLLQPAMCKCNCLEEKWPDLIQ